MRNYIVVGAGMGGLAVALRLSHAGHRVTVLEKTGEFGGRNRPVEFNGCRFDGGPTLLMMLDPFRRLFKDVAEDFDALLKPKLMDPGYRVFYRDGTQIESTTDRAKMETRIRSEFGDHDGAGYVQLMDDLKSMYDVAIPNFVAKNFNRPADFLNFPSLISVIRHGMMGNLAQGIAKYVDDPKLRMLFSFQTMYLGLSPFEAAWVYAVLTYMEFGEGIFYPEGGIVRIAEVIAELAVARGAEIRLNSEVESIRGNEVTLTSGEKLSAEAVIVNADLPYAYEELSDEKLRPKRHSCSASVLYLDYHGDLPELLHHNVFFGSDFRGNLEEIFNLQTLPKDPAFYVAISSKSDPSLAPGGHLNLMTLTPCPNLDYPWTQESEEELTEHVFSRLESEVGFDRTKVVARRSYGPLEYRGELNLSKGAAFGLSHHFNQSAFFRPGNKSRSNPHLYFVGASTVPGNGLPMVLISAQLVEERLNRDFAAK